MKTFTVFQKQTAARGPPWGMPPNIENFYLEESPPQAARQQQSGAAPLKDLFFSGVICEVMRKEQKKRSRASGIPHKKKYRSPKASDRRERERRMSEPQPPLGGRSVAERVETATRRETSVASGARGGGDLRRVSPLRASDALGRARYERQPKRPTFTSLRNCKTPPSMGEAPGQNTYGCCGRNMARNSQMKKSKSNATKPIAPNKHISRATKQAQQKSNTQTY